MNELIKDKITRWSLERVRFVLAHIESFVEDENMEVREKARGFSAQTGLGEVESLLVTEPNDPKLPLQVLTALAPFFDSGLLLQRGPNAEDSNWWVTDLFWRGSTFHLDLKDQVRAVGLVPEITPLQVHRAEAERALNTVGMEFLIGAAGTQAYLFRPTPSTAYVVLSSLAAPWAVDHVAQAHTLVNKCFIY
ncbi:MAG: hypothetical protein KF799_16275 [Bdellovibrionales bacterium]|nr:hypothetical protein [Bdellovibrionales bacterium]